MQHKLGIIFVCLILINLSFISATGPISLFNEVNEDIVETIIYSPDVNVNYKDYCVDGGALFNESQICYNHVNDRIYSPILPPSYYTLRVLMVMIAETNRLRVEVNEIRKELDETKKELSELKKIVETMNDPSVTSETQIPTGAVIDNNDEPDSLEKQDKGILGFFRRIFGITK